MLAQTRTVQQRLRGLPSRTGVYFVLALGLFPGLGYARVWAKLVAGLTAAGLAVPVVSEKALRDLRRRLGPAPLKALFEVVAGPLAQPRTPGSASPGCARSPSTASTRSRCPTPTVTAPGWAASATGWALPATPRCG